MSSASTSLQSARPLALVTGASTGIGYAFVKLLAQEGYDVIAVARSIEPLLALKEPLEALCGAALFPLSLDLTSPEAAQELSAKVADQGRGLSLLINNAGFGTIGAFEAMERQDQLSMIDLNLRIVTELTHVFLPQLLQTKGGIINVASLSAFAPMPYMAVYGATKSYLLTFSKMLHHEVKPKGVIVTALCPGYTQSAFHERAGVSKVKLPRVLPKETADSVAQKGFQAWKKGRVVIVPGLVNKLTALLATPLAPLMRFVGKEADKRINP